MSDSDSDPDVSKLAREVIAELDSGRYGDKFVFSRRQLLSLAGAGLSVGALTTLGVDEATAQEAVGQVGTASEPVDVEAAGVNAGSVSTEEATINERDLTLGQNTSTNRDSTTVLGGDAQYEAVSDEGHNETEAVVIGTDAFADTGWSVTIGANAESRFDEEDEGDSIITIGRNATAVGHSNVVIGRSASATNAVRQTVMGRGASADGARRGISIGYQTEVSASDAISIGKEASCNGTFDVVIGSDSESTSDGEAVVIGADATGGSNAVVVGKGADSENGGIALGRASKATGENSIGLGVGARTNEDNTMVVGFDFDDALKLDGDGNLQISGELTENATL